MRESQNELRACPTSDARAGAHQLPRGHLAERQGVLVHRLLGHPGRRLRRCACPHVALEVVAEASVETHRRPLLTVAPAPRRAARRRVLRRALGVPPALAPRRLGRGHRGRGRAADRDIIGDDLVSLVLGAAPRHRRPAQLRAWARPTSARRSRRCSPAARASARTTPTSRWRCAAAWASRPATCRATCSPATTATGADVEDGDWSTCRPTPGSRWPSPASGGWRSIRPTSRRSGLRHVKIGHGRDYDDVQPFRGVFAGSTMPDRRAPRRDPAPAAAAQSQQQ